MGRALVVVACLLVGIRAARADGADRPDDSTVNGRFTIEETNDKFSVFDSTDSQFTQGLKVRATWDPRWKGTVLGKFYEAYRAFFKPNRISASIEIGQDIYTPEDISPFREDDEVDVPLTPAEKEAEFAAWFARDFWRDRPYSSEAYLEYRMTGTYARPTLPSLLWPSIGQVGLVRWSWGLRGGYVGPVAAGQVQKAVHVLMRDLDDDVTPRDPQGWSFQQENNGFSRNYPTEIDGQWGGNLEAEVEWDLVNVSLVHRIAAPLDLRISGLVTAEAGMFRDLGGAGLRVEFGRLGREPLRCFPCGRPQDVPPACSVTDGPAVGGDVSSVAAYLYVLGRGRLTLYNRHLDNRMLEEDDDVEAIRRWSDADLVLGAVLRLWTFEFEFADMIHVKETREAELGRFHEVATIKVSALF